MRRLIVCIAMVVSLLALVGCGVQPRFEVDDVEQMQFWSLPDNHKRTATDEEVVRFVEAYRQARPVSHDNGTTPPARIDVTFKNGELLTVWSGGADFQTIRWGGRQSNIRSDELAALLEEVTVDQ